MNRKWDRDAQRRYAEELSKEPEIEYEDVPDPTRKLWAQCKVCGDLHSRQTNSLCKNTCCHGNMHPVQVERCGVCFGDGGYKDQWDEDRPAAMVRCDTCKGKGVKVKAPTVSSSG